jgi:hypothetical protein
MMQFLKKTVLVICFLVTFAHPGLTNDATITVDVENVIVPEGRTATFRVRLSVQPDSPVDVTVSRGDGDTDIKVESGSNLTFTISNWDMYQTVTLQALKDGDTTNGSVTIRLSTPGMPEKHVVAVESDNGTAVLRPPRPPMNLRRTGQ